MIYLDFGNLIHNIPTLHKVVKLSENWSETLIKQFKKLLKHGGEILLEEENQHFIIETDGPLLNSRGEKDGGIFKGPSIEDRF